jgi:uncharacterized protein (TIGR02328 family)
MRLWHKDLIPVLPREQLVAQWRELSSIAGAIQKNGTPNHVLVNFVLDYDYEHFISYAYNVRLEMTQRGYRTMNSVWDKIISLKPDYKIIAIDDIYSNIMDNRYLTICYYNLLEKYIRGGIREEDWNKIKEVYEVK